MTRYPCSGKGVSGAGNTSQKYKITKNVIDKKGSNRRWQVKNDLNVR